jgi:hypothetical protein
MRAARRRGAATLSQDVALGRLAPATVTRPNQDAGFASLRLSIMTNPNGSTARINHVPTPPLSTDAESELCRLRSSDAIRPSSTRPGERINSSVASLPERHRRERDHEHLESQLEITRLRTLDASGERLQRASVRIRAPVARGPHVVQQPQQCIPDDGDRIGRQD